MSERVLGGCYRLIEEIGAGGMGTVYRASGPAGPVAVKVLASHATDEAARRFQREVDAVRRLDHPGCVRLLDAGCSEGGELYLVMELLEGRSLVVELAERRTLPPARAVAIARQLLGAVGHAHGLGVIHRDLKPENVFLVGEGVKVLDFGVARFSDGESSTITDAGKVFGTPEYLSPEQALGEQADGRADLYAIGVILYEMLVGARPFEGAKMDVIGAQITKPPPHLAPPLPVGLDAVVQRALAKRTGERFGSAAEFDEALAGLALSDLAAAPSVPPETGTRPLDVAEPGSPTPRPQTAAPRRALLALPLVFLVAIAAALAMIVFIRWYPAVPDPAFARASALLATDPLGARALAEDLVRRHPEDARAFVLLGDALYGADDAELARALAAYREAIRLDRRAAVGDATLVSNLRAAVAHPVHGAEARRLTSLLGAPTPESHAGP